MQVQVLGPIGASASQGRPLRLGGTQQQRLLAALASEPDRAVLTDRLIEILWPDAVPDDAYGTLQTYISRLRAQLGFSTVVTSDVGYCLATADIDLDAVRFERILARARTADSLNAMAFYDEALALWRGPAFGACSGEWWAKPAADRLEALRVAARGERVDVLLVLGRADEAMADTEVLVAADPLRESFVLQRMRAQHLGGRSAEALRVAAGFRKRMADQAGLEPSPALADLERRILDHDPGLVSEPLSRTTRGYVMGELLAEGAHGAVFAATQPVLARDVAIKVVRKDRADDPEFVRRFEAEAQLVARLEHPSIVPLYDYWREPGGAYLVFRLLRGGSLQDLLARGERVTVDRLDAIVDGVGGALAAAHRAGVVHRDVRPANVLFDEADHPYLADFGIAEERGSDNTARSDTARDDTARDDTARDDTARDETGRDETARDETARDRTARAKPAFGDPAFDDAVLDDIAGLSELTVQLLTRIDAVDSAEVVDLESRRSVLRRASTGEITTVVELLGEWRLARGVTTPTPTPSSQSPDQLRVRRRVRGPVVNPFKGLRPFTEAEHGDFFGRTLAAEQLSALVETQPLVMVVGPSGSGKSSLVLAGLVPQMRDGGFLVTTMTPGVRPMWSLAGALRRVATEAQVAEAGDDPAVLLANLAVERPLLLTVDQLEELWTVAVAADRDEFTAALDAALDHPLSQLRVVATVRADFYDRPLADARLGPRTHDCTYPLAPLTATELESAIVGPLTGSGVSVEPGLVTQIVADVGAQPGALPLLQFTLSTLFDARDGDVITHRAYTTLGGVAGAVASEAEDLHQQCSPQDQEQMRRLFEALVTPGDGVDDTRRHAKLTDLAAMPADVLERLDHARLVTFDRDAVTGEPTVEIAHESLLVHWPRLRTWIDASRDELQARRHVRDATAAWVRSDRESSHLFRGARLATTLERVNPIDVGVDERAFLDTSIAERDREKVRDHRRLRRTQTLLAATAVLLVAAVIAGAVAWNKRAEARDNATAAQTSARTADASARTATDARVDAQLRGVALEARTVAPAQPDLGMLLAAEVAQRRPGTESDGAVLATLQANPLIDRVIDLGLKGDLALGHGAGVPPGPIVVGTRAEVVVVDGTTLLPTGVRWPVDGKLRVAVSLDGTEATSSSRTGRVERHNVRTGTLAGPVLQVTPGSSLDFGPPVAYLADGSLAVANGRNIEIYPPGASTPSRTFPLKYGVAVLAASDDGHRLAASDVLGPPDSTTVLFDVATGTATPLGPSGYSLAFGPADTLYEGLVDGSVVAIDATTAEITAESPPFPGDVAHRLIPLPDGRVVYGRASLSVRVLSADLQTSRDVVSVSSLRSYAALPGGRLVGGANGQLVVVDLDAQPSPVTTVPLVGTVFPKRIGARFVLSDADGARVYDAATLQPAGPVIAELAKRSRGQIDLSPDASLIAAVNLTDGVVVYDAATGGRVGAVLPGNAVLGHPTFSPNGSKLAMATATGIAVYSVPDLTVVGTFQMPIYYPLDVAWSPDSVEFVYVDGVGGSHRINRGTRDVTPVDGFATFSNDGAYLATVTAGEPIRVVGRSSGKVEAVFGGFREVAFVRYLTGDTRLFRATVKGYVDLIDTTNGSRIGEPFRFGERASAAYRLHIPFFGLGAGFGVATDGTYALFGAPGAPVQRLELDPHRWSEMACTIAGRNLTQQEWKRYFGTIAAYDVTCPQYPPGT
jgi:serine/threonine protein kinase/energy-coupling factor transporter ATP-binding protein EcfA2